MLGRVPQAALDKAAADPRYRAVYRKACDIHDAYMQKPPDPAWNDTLVAYFSMEYGLIDCMQIYSGGLGILSGDHLKSSSDAGMPLVGIGLLYQTGYLKQSLNQDGWQQERNPVNDFYTLPITPCQTADGKDVIVNVQLPTGTVYIKVWRIDVGRVKLYVLDTNIPENERPDHRDITDQLYGGDIYTRMRQEIVLGIGGLRALKALGIEPTVYHMNEGHSAFLAIERIREMMKAHGLTFYEALDASRTDNVFTTHTPVPAGIDLFDAGMMYEYFNDYCREGGIGFDQLLALGRRSPSDHQERFSMAIAAMNASSYRNAVSRLHRTVSQELWQELWPKLPVWEVPITSVTNGVHLPTWLSGDLAGVYDHYLQPDWREQHHEPKTWDLVDEIPTEELWESRKRRKRRLVSFIRERSVAAAIARKSQASEIRRLHELFDPDVFTIGFARRFATYKRATLLFRDVARLKRILTNPKMPVQIVIAGKAHPKDNPGKLFIREIVQLSRDPELSNHIIFMEDYSLQVARELVQGVDLWLNTPRRGEEACGTSGMKAAMNGVLNMSILDGWFDEAYEQSGGWAIGDRDPYSEDQDEVHARAIYSLLENEILPMYYEGRIEDVPEDWVKRTKQSKKYVSPYFNCQRMVMTYMEELYVPAHRAFDAVRQNGFQPARERARWNEEVNRLWPNVAFVELGPGPGAAIMSGSAIPLRASVELAGLKPGDVRVEAVVGRVGPAGQLENTQILTLPPIEQKGTVVVFGREFVPFETGRLGYSLRVSPNHYDDPLTRPCNSLLRWGGSN